MLDSEFQHNFHTHTFRCKHAKGDVADYCEMAIARGMKPWVSLTIPHYLMIAGWLHECTM